MELLKNLSAILVSTLVLVLVSAIITQSQTNKYKRQLKVPSVKVEVKIDNVETREAYLKSAGIIRE